MYGGLLKSCALNRLAMSQPLGMDHKSTWLEGPTILIIWATVNTAFGIEFCRGIDAMDLDVEDANTPDQMIE